LRDDEVDYICIYKIIKCNTAIILTEIITYISCTN